MTKQEALRLIESEYDHATQKHNPFVSAHEGYAVILEELDELKAEVFKRSDKREKYRLTAEAKQVSAMALRFLVDLC